MRILTVKGQRPTPGPESCVRQSNQTREALTGGCAGRVLSREKEFPREREVQDADALGVSGRRNRVCRYRKAHQGPARSETPGMYTRTSHGNREILRSSAREKADRIGSLKG
jgi:hypothetical protein